MKETAWLGLDVPNEGMIVPACGGRFAAAYAKEEKRQKKMAKPHKIAFIVLGLAFICTRSPLAFVWLPILLRMRRAIFSFCF